MQSLTLFFKTKIWNNQANRFLFSFLSLTLLFYFFNLCFIGITAQGSFYLAFIDKHLNYIKGLRDLLIETSAAILRLCGFKIRTSPFILHINGYGGVILVYSCLGYALMGTLTAFAISWPGKKLLDRVIFILIGIIIIQALNVARFIGISLLARRVSNLRTIDHHTIFNAIVYLVLVAFTYFWTKEKTR